jgi:hypothetical protein
MIGMPGDIIACIAGGDGNRSHEPYTAIGTRISQ